MNIFFDQLFAGIATGGTYASLALALVLIYKATHLINFAQGEMAMFSTYIAWLLIQTGMSYWLAFSATVVLAFCLGVFVQRVLIRPVEKAPELTIVIVFIALLVILNSLAGWLFTYTIKVFPSPFPEDPIRMGEIFLPPHQFGAIAVTLAVLSLVYAFFRFTSLGLAMRGAAANAESSRLVGISVGTMLALGWGLAASVGAVAGIMVAPSAYLDPNMMSGILVYAFASALLGGIDSPDGAVIGGFFVGIAENLLGTYIIGSGLKLTLALVLIVGVLLVRPQGFFGSVRVSRV